MVELENMRKAAQYSGSSCVVLFCKYKSMILFNILGYCDTIHYTFREVLGLS